MLTYLKMKFLYSIYQENISGFSRNHLTQKGQGETRMALPLAPLPNTPSSHGLSENTLVQYHW